jgi:hypothetical protein
MATNTTNTLSAPNAPCDQFGPVYPDLGAGVAKHRRIAAKAGSVMGMSREERHAYADAIEKAIRAKHRTLHMKPTPPLTGGWYSKPSIARLLKWDNPVRMAGDPPWLPNGDAWASRQEAVYAAAMEAKRAAEAPAAFAVAA